MGEENFAQTALVKAVQGTIAVPPQSTGDLRVATPGGVFQVRWDDNASASALGQLAFFAEFLEVSGLFVAMVLFWPDLSLPASNRITRPDSMPKYTRQPCPWSMPRQKKRHWGRFFITNKAQAQVYKRKQLYIK
jgi:hypothetical protein